MQYFYSYRQDAETCLFDDLESRHILKSLRKRVGDEIHVLDGKGKVYRCRMESGAKDLVQGHVLDQKKCQPLPYQLHLAIAVTKNQSRLEVMLEKATEMGLARLLPMYCQHSERSSLKEERLHKIAISAAKQSGNPFLPQIDRLASFSEVVGAHTEWTGTKKIAYLSGDLKLPPFDKEHLNETDILLLIGPEGDFSKEEISLATGRGFGGASLGSQRLRTETAGIFAAATVYGMNL